MTTHFYLCPECYRLTTVKVVACGVCAKERAAMLDRSLHIMQLRSVAEDGIAAARMVELLLTNYHQSTNDMAIQSLKIVRTFIDKAEKLDVLRDFK